MKNIINTIIYQLPPVIDPRLVDDEATPTAKIDGIEWMLLPLGLIILFYVIGKYKDNQRLK